MKIFDLSDSRDFLDKSQKTGVYCVVKKNIVARFTFGNTTSSFKTMEGAHNALTKFLNKRKDSESLYVTVLNNHF